MKWLFAWTLLLFGCDPHYGYAVRVDVDAAPALSEAALASVRSLTVIAGGAESGSRTLTLARFSSSRQERFVYRPSVKSGGTLTLQLIAADGDGATVAAGEGTVTLRPGATVALTVTISADGLPLAVTPDHGSVARGDTLELRATRPVQWSVRERDGGSVGAGGLYQAPAVPGIYHVVATTAEGASAAASVVVGFHQIAVAAGVPGGAGNRDGNGADVRFDPLPFNSAIVGAPDGTLYVADRTNRLIRRVDPQRATVTTVVDARGLTAAGDPQPTSFTTPVGLAIADGGKTLYVSDVGAQVIDKIDLTANPPTVSTFSGNRNNAGYNDASVPTEVRYLAPVGLAVDAARNRLYVTDNGNNRIRSVDLASGGATTLAGNGASDSVDSTPGPASFNRPAGIVYDGTTLWVSDIDGHVVRKVTLDPVAVTTMSGKDGVAGNVDSFSGSDARFNQPCGLVDGGNLLLVVDRGNHNVRVMGKDSGAALTFIGSNAATPAHGFRDGMASMALLEIPSSVTFIGADLYLLDDGNYSVRKVPNALNATPAMISTVVGQPYQGGAVDGTGSAARVDVPKAFVAGPDGNLYFSDFANNTLRRLTLSPGAGVTTGTLALVAGQPKQPGAADGTGTAAGIGQIHGFASDGKHTIYFTDYANNAIRAFDTGTQAVSTLATGVAKPRDLVFDGKGTLYFTQDQHTIAALPVGGGTPTVSWGLAGTAGFSDGSGSTARLAQPIGLAYDPAGLLWVADSGNHAIRKVDLATGMLTTVANQAGRAGFVDGKAEAARFNGPLHLERTPGGQLLVVDEGNAVVRVFNPASGEVATLLGTPGITGVLSGAAPGGLADPQGIALLAGGELVLGSGAEAVIQLAE